MIIEASHDNEYDGIQKLGDVSCFQQEEMNA